MFKALEVVSSKINIVTEAYLTLNSVPFLPHWSSYSNASQVPILWEVKRITLAMLNSASSLLFASSPLHRGGTTFPRIPCLPWFQVTICQWVAFTWNWESGRRKDGHRCLRHLQPDIYTVTRFTAAYQGAVENQLPYNFSLRSEVALLIFASPVLPM